MLYRALCRSACTLSMLHSQAPCCCKIIKKAPKTEMLSLHEGGKPAADKQVAKRALEEKHSADSQQGTFEATLVQHDLLMVNDATTLQVAICNPWRLNAYRQLYIQILQM